MAFNRILFQPGMSILEFLRSFDTDAQCAEALKAARWPGGVRCSRCSSADHCVVGHGARKLFQCNGCRHQTSLTAGSLMEHTKLPLLTWFLEFVAAVSVNDAGHPIHLKLCVLSGFSSQALGKRAKANLAPGTVVSGDRLGCLAAVTGAGCMHLPTVVGTLKPRDLPQFKVINTVLGNLKTTLAGAHHAMKYRKYAEHYLAAFAYRFSRRFYLHGLVARLVVDVARSKPVAENVVRAHVNGGQDPRLFGGEDAVFG